MPPLIDANLILRHLLADHPDHSPRASAFLAALGARDQHAILTEPIVFEVAFVLERREGQPRGRVRDVIRELMDLRGMTVPNKRLLGQALDLHVERNTSLVDAYLAALALESDGQVISFNRGFDRIPGVTRVEP